jgi:hypothetical protein
VDRGTYVDAMPAALSEQALEDPRSPPEWEGEEGEEGEEGAAEGPAHVAITTDRSVRGKVGELGAE